MKKILIIFILLGSLIFAGCGQQQWLSQDELFEKKQECANMKDNMWTETMDRMTAEDIGEIYKVEIDEVFYSSKANSCLYTLSIYKYVDMVIDNKYIDYIPLSRFVYDHFSKKELLSTVKLWDEEFNLELNLLKWE